MVDILQHYQDNQAIPKLDYAVDWGWFWFLTRPYYWLLDFFNKLLGNFGLAILALTVVVKLVFFPLASASYRAAFAPILADEELARRTPESFVARFEASLDRLRVAARGMTR